MAPDVLQPCLHAVHCMVSTAGIHVSVCVLFWGLRVFLKAISEGEFGFGSCGEDE